MVDKQEGATMAEKTQQVTVTVKTTRMLLLPTLPNYLRTPIDEAVDVGDLSEEQIREIGAKWTEALARKSRDRRGAATAQLNRMIEKQQAP
jgi:hypothetical protein